MFIKQVHIVNFRSLNVVKNNLDPGQIFDELPELNQEDYVDAIRFVLDPSYVADFRGTTLRGYVQLVLALHDTDMRPAVFIICEDINQREVTVTRSINEGNAFDVSLAGLGVGSNPIMDIQSFHKLWFGHVPVTSSKINLLTLGQAMRNQFFCLAEATSNNPSSDYPLELRERFDDIEHFIDIVQRNENSLNLIIDKATDLKACRVEQDRRQRPELEAKLAEYRAELLGLPGETASFIEANDRLLSLLFDVNCLKLKCNQQMSVQCSEEVAFIDAQLANVAATSKRMALNAQMPESKFPIIDRLMETVRNRLEFRHDQRVESDRIKAEVHAMNVLLLDRLCSRLSAAEVNRGVGERLARLMASSAALSKHIDTLNEAIIRQKRLIERTRNELHTSDASSENLQADLETANSELFQLDKQRFILNMELTTARISLVAERQWDLYQHTILKVFDEKTIFSYESLNLMLSDVRTDPAILGDFQGFVIDFVAFQEGFEDVADKVQYALSELLLTAIFQTNASVDLMLKLCKERCISFDAHSIVSAERYRSISAPLGLPLCPDRGFRCLTDYLQPIGCDVVQQMLDQFIVIDTDDYTIEEAVLVFRRHVICARTGFYRFSDGTNTYLGLSGGPSDDGDRTVFDLFAQQPNHQAGRIDVLAKIKKWQQDGGKINEENRELQLKIDEFNLQLKRNNFDRLLGRNELWRQERILFMLKNLLSRIVAESEAQQLSIMSIQSFRKKNFKCDPQTLLEQYSKLAGLMEQSAVVENFDRTTLQSWIELPRLLSECQLERRHQTAYLDNLDGIRLRMERSKEAFVEESAKVIDDQLTGDERVRLQSNLKEIAEIKQKLRRVQYLKEEMRSLKQKLRRTQGDERRILDQVDWEEYATLSDEMIVTQLKQYKHTMASSPDLLFKCKSRLEKSLHKLVSMRKCIGALMAVWYLTNNALSIVRYENLSSVVRTMNQLLPMVHGMGLKEFENASIQLFLIYDDAATRCCALEDTIELDAGRIRSFELIVHNTKTGSQIAIGRYEKRCMALLWHLAACVAFKRLHGVILLHKLIDLFPSDQRSQILYALAYNEQLAQCQAIVVVK